MAGQLELLSRYVVLAYHWHPTGICSCSPSSRLASDFLTHLSILAWQSSGITPALSLKGFEALS